AEDHGLVAVVVGLLDVLEVDLPTADLAVPLVADPPVVLVMDLMEGDVVRAGRPVQLHRHVHEAERDLTTPDSAHAPCHHAPSSQDQGGGRTVGVPGCGGSGGCGGPGDAGARGKNALRRAGVALYVAAALWST